MESSQDLLGRVLSHYRIIKHLGSGGMGEVFLAEDTQLDRKVALKILPSDVASDRERMGRFVREAKAASAIDHPNIVHVYEINHCEGVNFIVMQYVDGETLHTKIAGQALTTDEILQIAIQITDAMAEAHARGIIHRDLKPANIIISNKGHLKLLDFGLARVEKLNPSSDLSQAETWDKTKRGTVFGTIAYMSPEQALGKTVDHRSDIFSIGIILYEMATGQKPFSGSNQTETVDKIIHSQPESIIRLNYGIPQELDRIIRKCIEKDPQSRYQSTSEILIDLRNLKRDLEPSRISTDKGAPSSSRQPALWIGATLALILLLTGVYLVTERNRSIDSLAVLPLVNGSGDIQTEYLSDGITESLINSLSQVPKLRVTARTTVFRYKNRNMDPQKIGKELGVRAVLTGKVVERNGDLIIQADLVDVGDGTQLWGEQYQRKFADVLAVQSEIAKRISENLRIKLTGEEKTRLTKLYTENTEAYQLYLKGRYHWNKLKGEETKKAIEFFNQAIQTDQNYSLAYAGLADCYSHLVLFSYSPPKETFPKAKAAAMKAVELDHTLATAHTALGRVRLFFDWDWESAEKEFKQAIELNPNDAITREAYGLYLRAMAHLDESLTQTKFAQELDPLSAYLNGSVGWVLFYSDRYDDAIAQFRRTLEMDPTYGNPHWGIGRCYQQIGKYKEAIAEMQQGGPDFANPLGTLGNAYALWGKKDEVQKLLDQLKDDPVYARDLSLIYVGLGKKDLAMAWLEKAYQERAPWMIYLKIDHRYDLLRSDSRFADLMRRMKLSI